ncbi:hypothetical protein ACFY8X_38635 [Streptomyces tanashiensis]|uniref:hypothetical protein n=1 Tax=Streptomyces tanashiensis TaxID=67367 RepID=UPI0036F0C4CA
MTGPITDFNPGARNDARRDERYPAVLEQVRKMAWPAGNLMLPGSWADTLATDVMAAIRKAEGQHRLITHHTYEGPGPCQAQFYGAGGCGYPRSEHQLVEDDDPTEAGDPAPVLLPETTLMTLQDWNALTLPMQPTIEIQGPGGQPLVTLNTATGEMTFGPGYTPDAAAEAFWDAIDTMGLAPVRQDHAACAAKERAWALVGEWRAAAAARGEDPYTDPYAQALAAALTNSVPGPAAGTEAG